MNIICTFTKKSTANLVNDMQNPLTDVVGEKKQMGKAEITELTTSSTTSRKRGALPRNETRINLFNEM